MPRKLKLNDEVIKDLCNYISNGLTNKDACAICGIPEETFYSWLRDAENGTGNKSHLQIKIKLAQSLKKAEANFKAFHLTKIMKSSNEDWKASAWMLERKFPKEYAKVDRNAVVLSTDNGMLPQVLEVITKLNKEEDEN